MKEQYGARYLAIQERGIVLLEVPCTIDARRNFYPKENDNDTLAISTRQGLGQAMANNMEPSVSKSNEVRDPIQLGFGKEK